MKQNDEGKQRPTRRTTVQAMAGAALSGAALGALGAGRTARADADSAPIVGAWLAADQATRRQGVLIFFHDDGIVQFAGSPIRLTHHPNDPAEAIEHQTVAGGQWVRTGFNDYAFANVGIDYDAEGVPVAMDSARGTLTYEPLRDEWTGTYTLTETDLNGTPTGGTVTAAVVGRRIALSP